MNYTKDTLIFNLTVAQFEEILSRHTVSVPAKSNDRRYEYGIRGIAKIFGCSNPTAIRLKKSGVIDGAIVQTGRKIVIDADLALELAGKNGTPAKVEGLCINFG